MSHRIVCALTVSILAAGAAAQPAPAEFEVASVRQNTLDDHIVTVNVGPGGRFAVRGYTLVLLMQRAYSVMDWNVTGGAAWIRSDRFDVVAKANVPGNLTEAQLRPRLAKLLADRFKLQLHHSSYEAPGYAMEVAKGGPKLTTSAASEEQEDTFRFGNLGMSAQAISMRNVARFTGGKLGIIVADETGLTGLYDFKVDWKVDHSAAELSGADPREALRQTAFDAIAAKLGLKIVPRKVAVPTLVIDHVEKPSEN